MSAVLLFVSALVLCSFDDSLAFGPVQLKGSPLEDNALSWIQQKEVKATDELTSAKQLLDDTVKRLIDDGKIEIDSSVDKALQDIASFQSVVPKSCHETATKSLKVLRQTKKDYFLKCVDDSASVRQIGRLSEKSDDVGAGFFSMTKEGTDKIVECSRQGVFGAYQCGTSAVWEIVKKVMSGYSDMKHFIVSFTAHGTHARRDIHDCLHPEGIDIQDHVDKIMADYHTYASKAYDLSRNLDMGDLNSRHHRSALLQMATALRKQGELGDAHDYCTEATRLSLVSGDQCTYAKSIRIMGDIYRKKSEISNAYRQYESAMNTASSMGDRLCQMEAMDGAARCLEALRLQHKICNCRPLEFNTRLLEVAMAIGSKLLIRTVRVRLCRIYQSLGDEEHREEHANAAQRLEEELELQCGACNLPFGYEADSLEALPCAHILHARCAHDLLRRRDKGKKKRSCPECERSVSSRLYLQCNDENHHQSTFSLASLHAASSSV